MQARPAGSEAMDRIADAWGARTPYGAGGDWPIRVDTFLADGVAPERVDRWVPSACVLCSNGCGLDIAVAGGRMVKAGYTGKGVDVAVIDTGTAPVPGLATAGKIINGPDLSFESQTPNLRYLDTYGHGTHMAGIVAGRGAGAVAGSYAGDTTNFLGMAPDARIVSVKVADALGAADVSQVIAAIDWVVQNKNTGGLNIRVLNLSFGTNTSHPYTIDPLCHAVEAAWKKGITVVAATGNAGYYMTPGGAGLTSPARDPYVISVGATDTKKTAATTDDAVASFSSSGVVGIGGTKSPDLVARASRSSAWPSRAASSTRPTGRPGR